LNKKLFLLYARSLYLSIRLVIFEKYNFILMVLWWLFAFILAFIARGIYPGAGLVVVGLAFFTQKYIYRYMERFKSSLIRIGDRVEFAEDTQNSYVQKFDTAKVLRKMRGEDVAITGLFDEKLIPMYTHFYLVALDDKNAIIPYEWILSLDVEELVDLES